MCWSKPKQYLPTTKHRPMDNSTGLKLKCPEGSQSCNNNNRCVNGVHCCRYPNFSHLCACPETHEGQFCEKKRIPLLSQAGQDSVAEFSIVFGSAVILLFVILLIVFQVKFYRRRKKRILRKRELNAVSKPDVDRHECRSFRVLRDHPGYSWTESVRRQTKAFQKARGMSCCSVPDDLFMVGVPLAQKANDGGGDGSLGRDDTPSSGLGIHPTKNKIDEVEMALDEESGDQVGGGDDSSSGWSPGVRVLLDKTGGEELVPDEDLVGGRDDSPSWNPSIQVLRDKTSEEMKLDEKMEDPLE